MRDVRPSPPLALWALTVALAYSYLLLGARAPPRNPGSSDASVSPYLLSTPASPLLPDAGALRALWHTRHFVFAASPGRAGSRYLAAVLGAAHDVLALHEPRPQMTGDVLRGTVLSGRAAKTFEDRAADKVGAIYAALAGTAANVGYAETSHMFVKTFADVVLRRVVPAAGNVTLVVLERDVSDVVWSQVRLGWMRDGHAGLGEWYYDVGDVDAGMAVDSDGDVGAGRTQAERLFWYNADVAVRTRAVVREVRAAQREGKMQNVRIVQFRVGGKEEDAVARAARFLEDIGLVPDPGRLAVLGLQDVNAREAKKNRVDRAAEREEVMGAVTRLAKVAKVGGKRLFLDGLINLEGLG